MGLVCLVWRQVLGKRKLDGIYAFPMFLLKPQARTQRPAFIVTFHACSTKSLVVPNVVRFPIHIFLLLELHFTDIWGSGVFSFEQYVPWQINLVTSFRHLIVERLMTTGSSGTENLCGARAFNIEHRTVSYTPFLAVYTEIVNIRSLEVSVASNHPPRIVCAR